MRPPSPDAPSRARAAPGSDAVQGAWTDAYRLVWCWVYELDGGTRFTSSDVVEQAIPGCLRRTALLALEQAEAAGLVSRAPGVSRKSQPCFVYTRTPWPNSVSTAWLTATVRKHLERVWHEDPERLAHAKRVSARIARRILTALESGGFISGEFTPTP